MKSRLLCFGLVGTLVSLGGCMALPGSVPKVPAQTSTDTASSGVLSLGFAGSNYSVQALPSSAATGSYSSTGLTFSHVYFTPTKIEVHYAGELTDAESATDPSNIVNQVDDESSLNASDSVDTDPEASDSAWITIPVQSTGSIDLANLSGTQLFALGGGTLSQAGNYDQIRLTGGGTYEATDASGAVATGSFFLPSGRLYLSQGFEIRDGYSTALTFNFDAHSSMVSAGPMVLLKPNSVKVNAVYSKIATDTVTPEASN